MDRLAADGFVVLGGPLGDDGDVLLAINAGSETEVRLTLERDPWSTLEVLELKSVQPWTVLLESHWKAQE
jgi:hypothetical protein